jgi:DNA-binding IscR family transcriptional regulator
VALRVALRLAEAFLGGRPAPDAESLAAGLSIPARPVEETLEALRGRGIAAPVLGADERAGWLLARDPASVRVADLLAAIEERGSGARLAPEPLVEDLLSALGEERRGSARNLSLLELARRSLGERAGAELGALRPGVEAR